MYDLKTKILIVDDMKTMRKITAKACQGIGFSDFLEAEDGQKAWETLNDNPSVGLIISDWNMPNCTGLDFLKRVRADGRFKTVPFLMVTAENEAGQVKEAILAGVTNYLVKPFSADNLKSKLEECYAKNAA